MHNKPRLQLCELITEYGTSLCDDPRRCEALLKDYCGQYKREIFVLVSALKNRVTEDLLKTSVGVPQTLLLTRLIRRLEDDLGFAKEAAIWAVESWAIALGMTIEPVSAQATMQLQPQIILANSGRLKFPIFSVGKVCFGSLEERDSVEFKDAIGEIDVPLGEKVKIIIGNDSNHQWVFDNVKDLSFFESCDPKIIHELELLECIHIEDIVSLRNLTHLKSLYLNCRKITDASLVHLKSLINLQALTLSDCEKITGPGLENLSKLANLRSFTLCSPFSGKFMVHLKNLKYLEELCLEDSIMLDDIDSQKITNKGIGYIKNLKNLNRLYLIQCKNITCSGVVSGLKSLTNLKKLNLGWCDRFNDGELMQLKNLTSLKSLYIYGCFVTDAEIEKLRKVLPNTYIPKSFEDMP